MNFAIPDFAKKPTNIIIALLVVALGAVYMTGKGPSGASQIAEATWSPEALSLASSVAQDISEYGSGSQLVQKGSDMMAKSAAAAKGKDLVLCAEYKARYDRETKKLVSDAECPLL